MCFGLAQFYLFVKYKDLISYIILNNKDTMGPQQNKFAPQKNFQLYIYKH